MKFKRWLLIAPALVVVVAAAYGFLAAVPASVGYSVESQFSALPATDAPFEEWLMAQPGVVPDTVHVERAGPKDTVLKVRFIQSRNLLGHPRFPALDQVCRELGYGQPVLTFHDSPAR